MYNPSESWLDWVDQCQKQGGGGHHWTPLCDDPTHLGFRNAVGHVETYGTLATYGLEDLQEGHPHIVSTTSPDDPNRIDLRPGMWGVVAPPTSLSQKGVAVLTPATLKGLRRRDYRAREYVIQPETGAMGIIKEDAFESTEVVVHVQRGPFKIDRSGGPVFINSESVGVPSEVSYALPAKKPITVQTEDAGVQSVVIGTVDITKLRKTSYKERETQLIPVINKKRRSVVLDGKRQGSMGVTSSMQMSMPAPVPSQSMMMSMPVQRPSQSVMVPVTSYVDVPIGVAQRMEASGEIPRGSMRPMGSIPVGGPIAVGASMPIGGMAPPTSVGASMPARPYGMSQAVGAWPPTTPPGASMPMPKMGGYAPQASQPLGGFPGASMPLGPGGASLSVQ